MSTFGGINDPVALSYLRFARPSPKEEVRTETILNDQEMKDVVRLSQKVEIQYCLAKKDYYTSDCQYSIYDIEKPRSLDLEYKFLGNRHQILCKQVREFSGK